jgi:hypothetical protein
MSGQNIYGPANSPLFNPDPVRAPRRVKLPLQETLWSWPDAVSGFRQSGLWVPPFDCLVVKIVISQLVVGTVEVTMVSSTGEISTVTSTTEVNVQVFDDPTRVSSTDGWVRADVTGDGVCSDLVISLWHARSQW